MMFLLLHLSIQGEEGGDCALARLDTRARVMMPGCCCFVVVCVPWIVAIANAANLEVVINLIDPTRNPISDRVTAYSHFLCVGGLSWGCLSKSTIP